MSIRPRRILLCNYEYPPIGGGGGTCSRWLARELVKRGNRVEVVTSAWGDLPRLVRKGRFTLRRVWAMRKLPGQSNPKEMMSYVLSAAPWLVLRGGPLPDAVVSFHSIPSGLAAMPMSWLRRVPHIVLFRGGDVPGWLPGELDKMHKRTLWLNRLIVYTAAVALANSEGLRALAQPSFPKKKIGILQNGVDSEFYRPPATPRNTSSDRPLRLVFVGRLTTQKGVDVLLSVLGKLRDFSWELDIAGDGPLLDSFREQAVSLRIDNRVNFHGWLTRAGTRRLCQRGDVFVFPSRYEGMSNALLEAMSCGLAPITTAIAGSEDVVRHEETGLLFQPDDAAALEDHLRAVLTDRSLVEKFSNAARREIVENWSWIARAIQLEGIVDGLRG